LLFPVFLLLFPLLQRPYRTGKIFAQCGLFLALYALTLAPWLARNNAIYGYPFLSSIGYDSLLYFTGAAVKASAEHISMDDAREKIQKESGLVYGAPVAPDQLRATNRRKAAWARSIIAAHPAAFMVNYARSVVQVLFFPVRSYIDRLLFSSATYNTVVIWGERNAPSFFTRIMGNTSLPTAILCVIQLLLSVCLYALIARGIISGGGSSYRPLIIMSVLTVVFFTLMSGAPGVDARFRVPLMPFLALLAAFAPAPRRSV
jgi:hypothetical protein